MHIQNSQIYKKIIGSIPYITTIITGIVIYILAGITHGKFSELLVNIAASFFAIPLLYLFYEKARAFSHERLHKEIFDYAKMQVDREVLSIINQLKKTVLTIEDDNPTIKTVNEFLSNKKEDLVRELRTNKYIGFQVFKNWEISEKTLHDLLKNPFVLEKMKDEQIISVIGILKSLRDLEEIQKSGKLYTRTNEVSKNYVIKRGLDMNQKNNIFPDRHMLLKHVAGDKYVVCDFGDILEVNLGKCLTYYKVDNEIINLYAEVIFNLLRDINSWLDETGSELIVDTKMFKMRYRKMTGKL